MQHVYLYNKLTQFGSLLLWQNLKTEFEVKPMVSTEYVAVMKTSKNHEKR